MVSALMVIGSRRGLGLRVKAMAVREAGGLVAPLGRSLSCEAQIAVCGPSPQILPAEGGDGDRR